MISKAVFSVTLFFYMPLYMLANSLNNHMVDTTKKSPSPLYKIARLRKAMHIDANWNKAAWKKIKAIKITNYMGKLPAFKPEVEAKNDV
jgi:hypothetical protein